MPDPVLVPGEPEADAPVEVSETVADLTVAEPGVELADNTPREIPTKHGVEALAASPFASMTSAEVQALIDAGQLDLGHRQSVLCSDGYFCNPNA